MKHAVLCLGLGLAAPAALHAAEFHVGPGGDDANPGTATAPFRTIQRAADQARPGDVVTVHGGVYRERINPPRGGESDTRRIVYRAAPGEQVEIKGSEVVKNWVKVQDGVWKVTLPHSFFGSFNPYVDKIHGDWFDPRGREHHTGAVYLDGDWLVEAANLDEVLLPVGTPLPWRIPAVKGYLLNLAWLQPDIGAGKDGRIPAAGFAAQQGVRTAPCSEGGDCVGWIEPGDWVRYEGVDFGRGSARIALRAASASAGGIVEIRLDAPDGEVLGTCAVAPTGDWKTWTTLEAGIKPVSGVKSVCLVFKGHKADQPEEWGPDVPLWFARADDAATTIWAQFKTLDPNERQVEINVRRTVFYPDQPGRNFITVRGFIMRHAATPWAPPTAEQIGLIGTHWSKGWVIESNVVSHSTCSGISLGKHGDAFDNTSADTAEGYVKTIDRARQNGWNKETIGHHIVRGNTISYCEQAGIVGSLGAAFSSVTGNTIHDIHVRRFFAGAEMAGIKFHAAIDTTIRDNQIYRTCLGIWLDWMTQGTRVSSNLFHDNGLDLFVEVNHGPFLVDNNLFLSDANLLDISEGGAYAHNWFNGRITRRSEPGRETPYHPAHTTTVAGLANIKGGDNRFYNNILVGSGQGAAPGNDTAAGFGLAMYDGCAFPLWTGGNIFYNGAIPSDKETGPTVFASADPRARLVWDADHVTLHLDLGSTLTEIATAPVSTERLGKSRIAGCAYENPDGSPLTVDLDFFGRKRSPANPTAGPFENPGTGSSSFKIR